MNILFLDIDGVILPFGSYNDWYLAEATGNPNDFMSDCAERCVGIESIQRFCDNHGAEIVLISTWRYIFEPEHLKKFLVQAGLKEYLHDDWLAVQTGYFMRSKADDIQHWLLEHPEVKNWWILDDQDQRVPEGHWIKTDPYKGFISYGDDPCE